MANIQVATQGKSKIMMTKRCICLVKPNTKNVFITTPGTSLKKFKVNNIYNYGYAYVGNVGNSVWSSFLEKVDVDILVEGHLFNIEDFNKFFIDISEYREKRIDEILND